MTLVTINMDMVDDLTHGITIANYGVAMEAAAQATYRAGSLIVCECGCEMGPGRFLEVDRLHASTKAAHCAG